MQISIRGRGRGGRCEYLEVLNSGSLRLGLGLGLGLPGSCFARAIRMCVQPNTVSATFDTLAVVATTRPVCTCVHSWLVGQSCSSI